MVSLGTQPANRKSGFGHSSPTGARAQDLSRQEGHKNHMRAINVICRVGGLREAVLQGRLRSGLMHDVITRQVPYVLAGSIRDDGPLPDTLMNLVEAQERYGELLRDVRLVLMLSTMLHSIDVGNMLPAWVRVVCVDINPAVATKLADRRSSQTPGIVTDVALFLHQQSMQIGDEEAPGATSVGAAAGAELASRPS